MVCDLDIVEAARSAAPSQHSRAATGFDPAAGDEAVTVEVLARWFHERLADAIRAAGGEALAIRVWESPTAFGGYRAPLPTSSE